MSWSAEQYTTFEDERTRPVRDLLNAVTTTAVGRAVDLGCGPGNSTEVLAARFPGATVCGLDSSPDMIGAARKRLPGLSFDVAGVQEWDDLGPFDLILANAVLQWVPDHASLLPNLMRRLSVGGSLAVQMPDNLEEPAHRLMRQVASTGPWAEKLAGAAGARVPRQGAESYYTLLRPHAARVDVWLTTYHHTTCSRVERMPSWSGSRAAACGHSWRPWTMMRRLRSLRNIARRWPRPIPRWPTARCCSRSPDCSSLQPDDTWNIVAQGRSFWSWRHATEQRAMLARGSCDQIEHPCIRL